MSARKIVWFLVACLVASSGTAAFAQTPDKEKKEKKEKKEEKAPKAKPVLYAVVLVGTSDYRVIKKDEVTPLKKQLDADHKKAVTAWEGKKTAAKTAKQKFTDPKPAKAAVTVIGSAYKSQDEAREEIRKLEEKAAKEKAKKEKDEKPKKEEKPKKDDGDGGSI